METLKLTDQQRHMIERLGVFTEHSGMQPMEGRIMALLLVSDQPELTFDQVRDTLQVSKSAVSNALNMLMVRNQVDYITRPGDRKRYFRSSIQRWQSNMEEKFKQMLSIKELMKEVLNLRTESTPEFNRSLADMIEYLEFLQVEMPGLFRKWKAARARNDGSCDLSDTSDPAQ